MTITLPEEMRDELERKAKAGGFATVGEYFLNLAAADSQTNGTPMQDAGPPGMSPRNRAELDAMLDAGMASGPPIRMTPEFWEERRRVLEERMAKRKGTAS